MEGRKWGLLCFAFCLLPFCPRPSPEGVLDRPLVFSFKKTVISSRCENTRTKNSNIHILKTYFQSLISCHQWWLCSQLLLPWQHCFMINQNQGFSLYPYLQQCRYTGCPKQSRTLDFHHFDIKKYSIIMLISSDKTLSFEKNDTQIIWFGSVVLILQPFLKHSHLQIC